MCRTGRASRPSRRTRAAVKAERMNEADVVAVVLFIGVTAYALFGGADFGAGFWDLIAGGAERGAATARADRPLDRPGLGGEPRLADLLPGRALDRVLRGVRVDHAHAVRAAHARRARHRAARVELRVPQEVLRTRDRRNFGARLRDLVGARAVLHGRGRRRDRVGPGAGRAGRRATRGTAGSTRPRSSAACSRSRCARTSPRSTWSGTRAGSRTPTWSSTSAAGRSSPRSSPARSRSPASSCCTTTREYLFDGLTSRGLPLVILSGLCGLGSLVLLVRENHRGARLLAIGRGGDRGRGVGRRAVALHPPARR